jgi:hypothetical protein
MKRIWKFPLKITDRQTITVPMFHKILTVQMQNGVPTVWVLVDPETEEIQVEFTIVGTGNPTDVSACDYVGSVQERGFVWHVFSRLKA